MSAYLCWHNPIIFKLENKLVLGCQHLAKNGTGIVDLTSYHLGARPGGDHVVLTKLEELLEGHKLHTRKKMSLKIFFRELVILHPTSVEREPFLHFRIDGELLQDIKDMFGPHVRIQLQLLGVGLEVEWGNDSKEESIVPVMDDVRSVWESPEMMVTTDASDAKVAFCEDKIQISDRWAGLMKKLSEEDYKNLTFIGSVNLIVSVVQPEGSSPREGGDPKSRICSESLLAIDTVQINKRLLQEGLGSDVEIVAGNGIGVKCHRSFLSVHSEVLTKMLASGLEESRTKKIGLPDVSEDGVRAFLAYLYYKDLTKPLECCSVAIELFQLGHKYLIGRLEDAMKNILLEKPEIWFEAGPTIWLFFFAGKLDNHQDLRLKAISVLKLKPSEMLASQEYQRLFEVEDDITDGGKERRAQLQLEAAKELFSAVMSPST